jgi:hypothetical protein
MLRRQRWKRGCKIVADLSRPWQHTIQVPNHRLHRRRRKANHMIVPDHRLIGGRLLLLKTSNLPLRITDENHGTNSSIIGKVPNVLFAIERRVPFHCRKLPSFPACCPHRKSPMCHDTTPCLPIMACRPNVWCLYQSALVWRSEFHFATVCQQRSSVQ